MFEKLNFYFNFQFRLLGGNFNILGDKWLNKVKIKRQSESPKTENTKTSANTTSWLRSYALVDAAQMRSQVQQNIEIEYFS